MKKYLILFLTFLSSFLSYSQERFDQNVSQRIIVVPKEGQQRNAEKLFKDNKARVIKKWDNLGWYLTELPPGLAKKQFEDKCRSENSIISRIYQDEVMEYNREYIPNDSLFNFAWHIRNSTDRDIDADEAWDLLPNTPGYVTVAVFDGGFETTHEDLVGRFNNPWNAVTNTAGAAFVNDFDRHGVACCGTIAATVNNQKGCVGVGGNKVQVQPVNIMSSVNSDGSFSTTSSIQINAVNAAIANPTCVAISMSYGGSSFSQALSDAFNVARTTARGGKGILIFASSGNNGSSTAAQYPAQYPSVWGVGSTTSSDLRSSFSNYGPIVDISAPGSSIQSTDRSGAVGYNSTAYASVSGTSFSCPITAGVAAMIAFKNPNLTAVEIFTILSQTCEKVGGYVYSNNSSYPYSTRCVELGYGRINAKLALQATPSPGGGGTTQQHNLTITNLSASPTAINVGQTISISCAQNTSTPTLSQVSSIMQYRFSTDNVWGNTDDIIIGTDTTNLGGGVSSGGENITYVIPNSVGTRYILAKANFNETIQESSLSDNVSNVSIQVSNPVSTNNDLAITLVTPNSPFVPTSTATSVSMQWRVTNTGQTTVTSFKWGRGWVNCPNGTTSCESVITWTGTISPGQSVVLPNGTNSYLSTSLCFSSTNCAVPVGGTNTYRARILNVNNITGDSNSANNQALCVINRTAGTTTSVGEVTDESNVDFVNVFDLQDLSAKPKKFKKESGMKLDPGFYAIHTHMKDGGIEIKKILVVSE
jgi:subtilisin family serine protease